MKWILTRAAPRGRKLVLLLCILLPFSIKRHVYVAMLGWSIDPTAYIGLSLIDAQMVTMGPGSRIGHFSVIRSLRRLEIHDHGRIGQWNWISAAEAFLSPPISPSAGELTIGEHSSITSRHYLDCSGGISIGVYTTVAGVRSTFISHQIDVTTSAQTIRPIQIGSYCLVSSNVKFTPGAAVPERCLIAMGAVVVNTLEAPGYLYAGVPARPVKPLSGEYFTRKVGFVAAHLPPLHDRVCSSSEESGQDRSSSSVNV